MYHMKWNPLDKPADLEAKGEGVKRCVPRMWGFFTGGISILFTRSEESRKLSEIPSANVMKCCRIDNRSQKIA